MFIALTKEAQTRKKDSLYVVALENALIIDSEQSVLLKRNNYI